MAKGGYEWSLDGALPVIEDHSRAKHDVLRAYLINYLRILAQHPRSEGIRVTLVDGFAGGGRYRTESGEQVSGSPIVLLEALQEARALVAMDRKQRGIRTPYVIDAHVHLVEQNRSTCAFPEADSGQLTDELIRYASHDSWKRFSSSASRHSEGHPGSAAAQRPERFHPRPIRLEPSQSRRRQANFHGTSVCRGVPHLDDR